MEHHLQRYSNALMRHHLQQYSNARARAREREMGHHLQQSSNACFSVPEELSYKLISQLQNQDLKNQENSSALLNKKTIDYSQRVIDAANSQFDLKNQENSSAPLNKKTIDYSQRVIDAANRQFDLKNQENISAPLNKKTIDYSQRVIDAANRQFDLKNQENSSALLNKKTIDYSQRVTDAANRQFDMQVEKLREGTKLSAEVRQEGWAKLNNNLKQNLDEVRQEHARDVSKLQAVIDELGLKLEAKEKEGWVNLKLSAEAQKLIAKELKLKLDGIQFAHVRELSKAQAKIDEQSLELVGKTKQVGDLEARLQADISRIDALRLEKLEDSHKLEQAEKTISDLKAESEVLKGDNLESAVEINRVKQELIDDNRRMKVKNESLRMELDAVKSLKNPAVACEATGKSNCSQGPVVEDDDWSVVEADDWGV